MEPRTRKSLTAMLEEAGIDRPAAASGYRRVIRPDATRTEVRAGYDSEPPRMSGRSIRNGLLITALLGTALLPWLCGGAL